MRFITLLTCLALLASASRAGTKAVEASFDPTVELVSIVFRLAEFNEYSQCKIPDYEKAIDAHFGPFGNHPLIEFAKTLRNQGIAFDRCMNLAIHLPALDQLQQPLSQRPEHLDALWTLENVQKFQALLADFNVASKADVFFKEQQPFYVKTAEKLQAILNESQLEWFDGFFGKKTHFKLIFSPNNGGANYGPRAMGPDGEYFYCILGVWLLDDQQQPRFNRDVLSTVAHEFAHSFINPVINANEALLAPGQQFLAEAMLAMIPKSYSAWNTVLSESMVRATVVRYVHDTMGPEKAEEEVKQQLEEGFVWTPELADLIAKVQAERRAGKVLEQWVTGLATFLETDAAKLIEQRAPKNSEQ